ncbi:MAG: Fe-S oxidoreductase [Sphingobacteriaceae bacterium]|jgi:heterodisulfide reductase subunit C|nr:Fe-S oxidoreductase [Sphingobacteriaceae bacterium]
MIEQGIFLVIVIAAVVLFSINVKKIIRNINLGRPLDRSDRPGERWATMLKVAFGQTKMAARPVPFILHFFVYAGFIIINIEVLEIAIDGLFGTHRVFSFLGGFYSFLIGAFEWLAILVLIACVIFLIRRNVLKIRRFFGVEMTSWPRSDANYILITEILLMTAFLTMNAADYKLQLAGAGHYIKAGAFPISNLFSPLLPDSEQSLMLIERFCWWFHIIGIFAFLNYLPYSKHFHILLAFPNTYYSKLEPKGEFNNMPSVTNEVKAMLDPSFTPEVLEPGKFGAKDATDLSWKSLMEAYTCTECGRCTSECPANNTGKLLSPRKIMMDTRDRISEIGKNIDKHGKDYNDGRSLLDDYITQEEIWACTTCNACTQACPVNIDPLSIIMELRRYSVMEESKAPASLNNMFGNVENNGAPWKYSPADRFNWAEKTQ